MVTYPKSFLETSFYAHQRAIMELCNRLKEPTYYTHVWQKSTLTSDALRDTKLMLLYMRAVQNGHERPTIEHLNSCIEDSSETTQKQSLLMDSKCLSLLFYRYNVLSWALYLHPCDIHYELSSEQLQTIKYHINALMQFIQPQSIDENTSHETLFIGASIVFSIRFEKSCTWQ